MKVDNGFDFSLLLPKALRHFIDCPKAMTLRQHTNLTDTTEVFCVGEDSKPVQIFVPEQILKSKRSKMGASFLFVKISLEEGVPPNYWLVVYSEHRQGFLFSIDSIEVEGNF